jgi:hypothetical protein
MIMKAGSSSWYNPDWSASKLEWEVQDVIEKLEPENLLPENGQGLIDEIKLSTVNSSEPDQVIVDAVVKYLVSQTSGADEAGAIPLTRQVTIVIDKWSGEVLEVERDEDQDEA